MVRIEHLLVGTDFSEIAEHAVECTVDLAAQIGASVTILHAYEPPMYNFPDGVVVSSVDTTERVAAEAADRLTECVERHKKAGVSVDSVLRMGAPWEELNSVAAEEGSDLVVVGTHGRRGFSRAILGSVAERLLRTSVRPVLVFRADS